MLNKVRARHGLDLPVEGWKKSYVLAFVLGALVLLAIVAPLLRVVLDGLVEHPALTAFGIASGLVTLLALGLFVRV